MESGSACTLYPIFCYGSNHPVQIATRLGVDISEVTSRAKPCTLKGYRRGFMNKSVRWDGKSTATIVKSKSKDINAFAFFMTEEQVAMMDKFESVPKRYKRIEVDLTDKQGNQFKGQVYKMKKSPYFEYPAEEYLKACAFTSMAYYYLDEDIQNTEDKNINLFSIKFDVWDCTNKKNAGNFEWTEIEYPEELRKLVKVLDKI